MNANRKRKWAALVLPALLVFGLAVACGDDNGGTTPTGPTIQDLAGTWVASPNNAGTSVLVTPNLNPAGAINLVTTLGGTITAQITTSARYTFTVNVAALGVNETFTGDFTITGSNTATLSDDDGSDPFNATFSLSADGNTIDITIADAELLDLTGDGSVDDLDAAELDMTLART